MPFTDSLVIAQGTHNKHHAIQQLIRKYESDFSEFGKVAFEMRALQSGQFTKVFLLNEEQATLLLTYLRNTKEIREFKKKLVSEFYKMRRFLAERSTEAWQETRQIGKLTRRSETDTIKQLAEYATAQGSQHADKLYMIYSKLANKYAGITNRDLATVMQLNRLTMIEGIISNVIIAGMAASNHYKVIYQDCKARLQMLAGVAYLEVA